MDNSNKSQRHEQLQKITDYNVGSAITNTMKNLSVKDKEAFDEADKRLKAAIAGYEGSLKNFSEAVRKWFGDHIDALYYINIYNSNDPVDINVVKQYLVAIGIKI